MSIKRYFFTNIINFIYILCDLLKKSIKSKKYVFMYKKKKQKKIPEKVPVYDEEYMIPK
ncbi:hypothetical protein CLOSPI_01689 [Thomasclavelia spiroformis DSM 1552]|uniref:Uncharacterized protein n=1 Tax=Thomasclavelia spiroformis DSM 1552 TaxID=428126 RepID=B1C373_9FIRM|nr:hypothetical protein CLOSPI_01689 [Thomasclavelia spiroformis DSM 1552]